ncbi:hypothetical protein NKDENANG_01743 [Candidatus Entotheonellaceae bacterium PAL068K]
MQKARALLVDLDGTVYAKGELIPGAAAATPRLRCSGFCLQFLTNTDSRTASELAAQHTTLGLSIPATEITTAVDAALQNIA